MPTTAENLKTAFAGESQANRKYLAYAAKADKEGHRAKNMLKWANAVEKVHAELYQQALGALQAGKDLSTMEIYLCPVCGHLEIGSAPDKCPVCGLVGAKYQKVS